MNVEKPNLIYVGRGAPVLLLHSSMSTKMQWYRLMQAMNKDYLMVAPDLYGYGDSPFPPDRQGFCFDHEIEFIRRLTGEILPPDRGFHLVGHSYGAATALRMAYDFRHTGRVLSLSIYEPVAFHLLPEDEEALIRAKTLQRVIDETLEKGYPDKAAEFFIDFWNGKGSYAGFPDEIRVVFEEAIKKLPLDFKALTGEPLTLNDYKEINAPVCLMAGKQSPIHSRRISELLSETLPHCRMHWLDAGHMGPVYQAEEVNGIVQSFIKEL